MPGRSLHRLTARRVDTLRKHGRYADGGGLYLQISKNGSKSWLFRFMLNGKARHMGLGGLHTVSLAEARDAALKCRKLLHEGVDPIQFRENERASSARDAASVMTFRQCTETYI
ncbi:MAG: Arm DNA-binding domain-containing protein, partial [Hyphomicrobiales bacterium]